ncbi:hypothetical protein [Kitasatospora sp. NPDC090091]|uniref:hypothetical protein n=1 Tax=Kitasatospora sp. NPDC090091 TaxID=3364081 RepID=UPI0038015161
MSRTQWAFSLDEDDMVLVEAPPGIDENLRLAVETLILGFGTGSDDPRSYLREWRRCRAEAGGAAYKLGTSSAGVTRLGPELVEIVDLYGQFEDCTIDATLFEAILEDLAAYLDESGPEQA